MTTPYVPPAPGAGTAATTSGYSYNPQDPYNLGVLAQSPVILAQTNTTTTTHQYNYTPGYGPGALGPGLLRANGVGDQPDGGTGLISTPGSNDVLGAGASGPAGGIVTPGSTTTQGIGNVAQTMTAYITDWMRQYASPSTRNQFSGVRAALANAGYYGNETWQRIDSRTAGLWDTKAMKNALEDWHTYASSTGAPMTFPQWLAAANGAASGGTGKQPTVTLMDPASIRAAAQNAAMQALGGGLSEDQLNQFVAQFQAQQVSNASKGTEDPYSTNTKLPGEAMAYVQKSNPEAFKANQRQTYVDALINMLNPGTNSQRPNMTPTPSVT